MLAGKLGKESKRNDHYKTSELSREIIFKAVPRAVPLIIKLGFVYLGFKRKAKKAGRIFEKELIANGIDKTTAKLLTQEYLKTSHFLRSFDFSGMASE